MDEMNHLEAQLRSWKPRGPSAGLKRNIFDGTAKIAPKAFLRFGWLAPTVACGLVALAVLNQENGIRIGSAHPEFMIALSNQSYAAYFPGSFQKSENGLPRDNFEWTNGGQSTSSMSLLRPAKTNEQD